MDGSVPVSSANVGRVWATYRHTCAPHIASSTPTVLASGYSPPAPRLSTAARKALKPAHTSLPPSASTVHRWSRIPDTFSAGSHHPRRGVWMRTTGRVRRAIAVSSSRSPLPHSPASMWRASLVKCRRKVHGSSRMPQSSSERATSAAATHRPSGGTTSRAPPRTRGTRRLSGRMITSRVFA